MQNGVSLFLAEVFSGGEDETGFTLFANLVVSRCEGLTILNGTSGGNASVWGRVGQLEPVDATSTLPTFAVDQQTVVGHGPRVDVEETLTTGLVELEVLFTLEAASVLGVVAEAEGDVGGGQAPLVRRTVEEGRRAGAASHEPGVEFPAVVDQDVEDALALIDPEALGAFRALLLDRVENEAVPHLDDGLEDALEVEEVQRKLVGALGTRVQVDQASAVEGLLGSGDEGELVQIVSRLFQVGDGRVDPVQVPGEPGVLDPQLLEVQVRVLVRVVRLEFDAFGVEVREAGRHWDWQALLSVQVEGEGRLAL